MIHVVYRIALLAASLTPLALASCGSSSHGAAAAHGAHGEKASHGDKGGKESHGGHGEAAVADSGHAPAATHQADPNRRHDPTEMVEVELGEYTITQRQPDSNIMILIRFKIFGVVERDEKETFNRLLEDRRQRMRDNVITIVQRAELEQLSDPTLGWLKSEIIPSINKLMRQRLLKDVVFSDFTMLQS